jgi:hypothetical protein
MEQSFKEILWQQFGASIIMLENAIISCPTDLWDNGSQFWYRAYHTLFYLDYYSSLNLGDFQPPSPFTLSEFEAAGTLPNHTYQKSELLNYLQFGRAKAYTLITQFTTETANHRFINVARNYSMLEMVIYNMRHIQHHTGQLNLLLSQHDVTPSWVSRADILNSK